ncbi:MAG TPA: hypothetical protein VJR03_02255 [Nitrospira sp.]|nr:hypothetical protein [Nitrospira sp.]
MNDRTRLSPRIAFFTHSLLIVSILTTAGGCAGTPEPPPKIIYESGRNQVRLVKDHESTSNAHPANLTPAEVGTLLRSVRSWERRNFIHRLFFGQADKTRAFRNEEIALLAPPLSKALAQAAPDERVYFHLSHPTDEGDEESTTGWLSIRNGVLDLALSEVHDRHGPEPDIRKYDRQMPNVPERSAAFDATFEPEEYLIKVRSGGRLFSPDQREELQIKYREALAALPTYPGLEPRRSPNPIQP